LATSKVRKPTLEVELQAAPGGDVSDPRRQAPSALQGEAEEALLRRYASERSPEIREELARRYMPLARSLALRYRRQTEPLDDLVGVANLGLVKAIDGFDPDRRTPFAAYAVPTILGELRRHFRDHVWSVRLPRSLGELTMKVDEAGAALTERLGRFPTVAEIAAELDLSIEDVLDALEGAHARRTTSLDAPRSADEPDATPIVESLGADEPGFERAEAGLAAASAGLDQTEWEVVRLRFVEQLTQREIGERLGVSQMQISRVSRAALWKLLAAVRGESAAGSAPPASGRERTAS
jgi:RNA polymerase sigma-B factor